MAQRFTRSQFGFPRWGDYGCEKEAEPVRMCDYSGCNEPGSHPAPKSPSAPDRWYFCKSHAAEYNQNWNYFQGMSDEEMRQAMAGEAFGSNGYASADPFEWGGALDEEGHSNLDHQAYDCLELDAGANPETIKQQYRKLAKRYHPDANPGDRAATTRFHAVQSAYDHLVKKHASRKK